jgi:hypothetical protein
LFALAGFKNPEAPAVKREFEEDWAKTRRRCSSERSVRLQHAVGCRSAEATIFRRAKKRPSRLRTAGRVVYSQARPRNAEPKEASWRHRSQTGNRPQAEGPPNCCLAQPRRWGGSWPAPRVTSKARRRKRLRIRRQCPHPTLAPLPIGLSGDDRRAPIPRRAQQQLRRDIGPLHQPANRASGLPRARG